MIGLLSEKPRQKEYFHYNLNLKRPKIVQIELNDQFFNIFPMISLLFFFGLLTIIKHFSSNITFIFESKTFSNNNNNNFFIRTY